MLIWNTENFYLWTCKLTAQIFQPMQPVNHLLCLSSKTRLGDSQAAALFSTFCWLQEDSTSTLAPNVALALESKDDSDLRSVTVKE